MAVPSVLLAEDYPDFLKYLQQILEPVELNLSCVLNGRDAITYVEDLANPLDLLITDLDMPHKTGWQVIEAVRQFRSVDLPIIMQTGEAFHPWVKTQAEELGIVLIDKLDVKLQLVPAVRKALGKDPHPDPLPARERVIRSRRLRTRCICGSGIQPDRRP